MPQNSKKELSEEQKKVMWEKGTERPFSGKYVDTKDDGMYHCASCDAPLFSSDSKFDSGTGWPSFDGPSSSNTIETRTDTSHGMTRTEVLCKTCKAHLGHLFDDGPTSTGQRYCINSVCLDLKKNGAGPASKK